MTEMGAYRPKRAKTAQLKSYDDNDKACDHNVMRLEICDEGKYFEENYVKRKLSEKKCYYPTHCLNCDCEICDKVPV